ncbi:DNA-binding protein [Ureibacillus terrenus]|uniref:DNA-binding protein n=1 Tax=Ureibacillus terrenus TaxID=118246 RepID=A0A540UVZ4_9BACL|nr:DNA-binding protein [Ureibacillus terrenus]TQE88655.1 DNA-binding protein [Ureibacillus terrenus]
MIQFQIDPSELFGSEDFRQIIREEIKSAVAEVVRQNQLPPMLNRKQLMELFQIGQTKCSELLNRPDFPVFREAGVLIPTHLLFQWIEKNTQWVEENTSYFKAG